MMAFALLAALASAAVTAITVCVRLESCRSADAAMLDRIQSKLPEATGKRRKKIDTMMRDLTAFGGDTATVLLAISGIVALLAKGNSALVGPFLLTLGSARGAGFFLKKTIRRPRPAQAGHALETFTSSFPSVHTAMGFVSSFALTFFLSPAAGAPWIALSIAAVLSAVIGTTRLYFAVHWPLDVLAGWIAGLMVSATSAYFLTG